MEPCHQAESEAVHWRSAQPGHDQETAGFQGPQTGRNKKEQLINGRDGYSDEKRLVQVRGLSTE